MFQDRKIYVIAARPFHEKMTSIDPSLHCRTRDPLFRQRIIRVPRNITTHINCVFQLHRDFEIRIVLGNRRIDYVIKNSRSRLLLNRDDHATQVLLLRRVQSRLSQECECENGAEKPHKFQYRTQSGLSEPGTFDAEGMKPSAPLFPL